MNNQIVLSALTTQLTSKQAELSNYEQTVHEPEVARINDQILQWFKDNVCEHVKGVKAVENQVSIQSHASTYSRTHLTIERRWKDTEDYMRFNTYSTDFKTGEDNDRLDTIVNGKIGEHFYAIQHVFSNVWNPLFQKASEPLNNMYSEVEQLDRSIRILKSEMESQAKDQYKKVGFACQLNPEKYIKNQWSNEGAPELIDQNHTIRLQTGRSNYDYMYVNSFKIKAINKYKCTLEVSNGDNIKDYEVTVTAMKFNSFIDKVFEWQNGESEKAAASMTERFNRLYAKYENA